MKSDIELDIDIFYHFKLDKTKICIKHELRSISFDLSLKLYHILIYISMKYVLFISQYPIPCTESSLVVE